MSIYMKLKVGTLTSIVILSFLFSTILWKHIESSEHERIVVASTILLCTYALLIFELVNRNLAALIGASVSIAAHQCLIEKVNLNEILQWEDLETLALLFGMMIIVNVLNSSGLFDFLAIWSYKVTNGHFWSLITIMSFITAILSAFIDNVSTMLLISPTLIKLSELEHLDPRYVLMIMIIFCNIGGCATPVGDPPNLIIIGNELIQQLNITFGSFVAYSGPCVLLTILVCLIYLRLVYKSKESFRFNKITTRNDESISGKQTINMLTNELLLTMQQFQEVISDNASKRMQVFKENLAKQILELQTIVDDVENLSKFAQTNINLIAVGFDCQNQFDYEKNQVELQQQQYNRLTEDEIDKLMQVSKIKSKPILMQSISVLMFTIILFFAESIPNTNLTLGWISLFAGLTLLVLSSSSSSSSTLKASKQNKLEDETNNNNDNHGQREIEINRDQENSNENFESVINNIEWSTLMFFFSLFIVMEVMAKLGLISFMGKQINCLIDSIPAGPLRNIGAITIILWSSGIASAFIDNVPFTSMMIKVLGTMIVNYQSARSIQDNLHNNSNYPPISVEPLVYALAFGACFGGNGTLIGASANLVTAGVLGRHGYPVSFNSFAKFTVPLTLISLLIANIYLILVFVVFGL